MNNTAVRAEAGQQSHPLPPAARKTNALLRDTMRTGQACRAETAGGTRPTRGPAQRDSSVCSFIAAPDHLSKSLQMQQPGTTFVMTACFRDT